MPRKNRRREIMDGKLLSVGMTGEMMTTEALMHPYSLPNLTDRAFDALFPEIPKASVRHRHAVLFGMMESGKTITLNYIAMKAKQKYGDQVNIIPCYSIRKAMDLINSQKVQLIMVDDAIREANSRQSMKQAEDVGDFFQIRHLYEAVARDKSGIVITIWACQRFKSLDIVFRQGHVLIFKTTAVDPEDAKLIRDYVGIRAYDELSRITERIFVDAEDSAKSESIVTIPISSGVQSGSFKTQYVTPFLKFIGSEEIYEPGEQFIFNLGAELQKLFKDRNWRLAAKRYYKAKVEGQGYDRIAKAEGVTKQAIEDSIDRMDGKIPTISGRKYEEYKARQLQQRGYVVQPLGGESQPDIIATHGQTKEVRIVSCKCMFVDRKGSIPIGQLNPEIFEAQRTGAVLVLSLFNLFDHTEQEIILDIHKLPKQVNIAPLG
jgi:hypothetical protein